jgi:hypothetical protein
MRSPEEERCAVKVLLIAVVGLALLAVLVLVGLYSYTDTTLP